MSKKLLSALIVATLLLSFTAPSWAGHGQAKGLCPKAILMHAEDLSLSPQQVKKLEKITKKMEKLQGEIRGTLSAEQLAKAEKAQGMKSCGKTCPLRKKGKK